MTPTYAVPASSHKIGGSLCPGYFSLQSSACGEKRQRQLHHPQTQPRLSFPHISTLAKDKPRIHVYQICETKNSYLTTVKERTPTYTCISAKEYLSTVRAATVRKIAPTAALEAGGNATSSALGSGGSKLGERNKQIPKNTRIEFRVLT